MTEAGEREPVVILGATSTIARGIASAFARRGYPLLLGGRNLEETSRLASDFKVRHGVEARAFCFDAEGEDPARALEALPPGRPLAGVVVCFGLLGEQEQATRDPQSAARIIQVNLGAAVALLTPLANQLEEQGRGFVAALASVAGDRGRQSNYIYGSAKGGLAIFLQGLRQRLSKRRVTVTTIKPGFVDTRMTWGLPGLFLVAAPERVGELAVRAILAGKPVVYLPWFWRWIMLIIRAIPERVFQRLKL